MRVMVKGRVLLHRWYGEMRCKQMANGKRHLGGTSGLPKRGNPPDGKNVQWRQVS